jgi:hypothetical protein
MLRLLLILSGTIYLAGCSSKLGPAQRVDPALATLLPSDTVFLSGVRVEALRATPVYKKHEQQFQKQLDEFGSKAGIDARKDLWEILAASNGKDSLVFARGKFSQMGLEPKLEREGAKRFSHKGYTLIGSEENAVAFLNPTTAAMGRTAGLRAMLDTKDQPKGGNVQTLLEHVQKLPSGQIWIAGMGGGRNLPVPPSSNLDNLNRMVQSVQRFGAVAQLDTGLKVNGEAVCSTDADAKQIHDAMRGLIGIGRLSTPENQPEMLRFYDAVKVSQEKNTVRIGAELTAEMLDIAVRMMERNPGRSALEELPRPR